MNKGLYDIFISYRRDGGFELAKHLYDLLSRDGYTVSFDIDTLRNGDFDKALINNIDNCQDFILIVDSKAFDRVFDTSFPIENDWMRQELAHTLKLNKNIVPIFLEGVTGFPAGLPEDISAITKKNALIYNKNYFDDFYRKLQEVFLTSKHGLSDENVIIEQTCFCRICGEKMTTRTKVCPNCMSENIRYNFRYTNKEKSSHNTTSTFEPNIKSSRYKLSSELEYAKKQYSEARQRYDQRFYDIELEYQREIADIEYKRKYKIQDIKDGLELKYIQRIENEINLTKPFGLLCCCAMSNYFNYENFTEKRIKAFEKQNKELCKRIRKEIESDAAIEMQKLQEEIQEQIEAIKESTNIKGKYLEESKQEINGLADAIYYLESKFQQTQSFVSSSIYAPAETSRGDFMLIQVYLYRDEEQEKVESKAKEVDPDAVRKNFTPLDVPVKKGDKVMAHLQMSGKGLELDETDIDMIWQDHYTDCQFSVYVPENYKPQSLVGTVTLSVNGTPAGRMIFKSKIVDAPRSLYAEIVSHKFNKIFISYSHLDEDKVKFIHQAYEALNVDHFFDRAYHKPGDVYPEKIKNYIASADLFILCWSENAKNSEYIQLEIADAMKRAYPGIDMDKATLAIHPLDIDPHAELPKEMNKLYNFGRM